MGTEAVFGGDVEMYSLEDHSHGRKLVIIWFGEIESLSVSVNQHTRHCVEGEGSSEADDGDSIGGGNEGMAGLSQ